MSKPIWRSKPVLDSDLNNLEKYIHKYGKSYEIRTWETKKDFKGIMRDYTCKKYKGSMPVATCSIEDILNEFNDYAVSYKDITLTTSDAITFLPLMQEEEGKLKYGATIISQAKYYAEDGYTSYGGR